MNDNDRFMCSRIVPTRIPGYDHMYDADYEGNPMAYVYYIKRDALMWDLIQKLTDR